ncbi:hypothetical protein HY213_03820 [Candidatus Peregrinibacteria bacterium]|nr:hypothetical protein [Candidatus Peregrinibacteria bacterium]
MIAIHDGIERWADKDLEDPLIEAAADVVQHSGETVFKLLRLSLEIMTLRYPQAFREKNYTTVTLLQEIRQQLGLEAMQATLGSVQSAAAHPVGSITRLITMEDDILNQGIDLAIEKLGLPFGDVKREIELLFAGV